MDLLVTTDWLASELGADDLVMLDCSVFLVLSDNGFVSESGRANFEEHHIAGAPTNLRPAWWPIEAATSRRRSTPS